MSDSASGPETVTSRKRRGRKAIVAVLAAVLGLGAILALVLALALAGGPGAKEPSLRPPILDPAGLLSGTATSASPGSITLDAEALRALFLWGLGSIGEELRIAGLRLSPGQDRLDLDLRATLNLPFDLPLGLFSQGLPFRARIGLGITSQGKLLEMRLLRARLGLLPLPPGILYRLAAKALEAEDLPKGIVLGPLGLELTTEALMAGAFPDLAGRFELRTLVLSPSGLRIALGLTPKAQSRLARKAGAAARAISGAGSRISQIGPGAALVAATLAASAPALEDLARGAVLGQLVFLEGSLEVRKGPGPARTLEVGDLLGAGDTLVTGPSSRAEIRLGSGAALSLAPDTTLVLAHLGAEIEGGGERTLSLLSGGVRAKVEKLLGKASFSIKAGSTVAGVRGTDFVMAYLEGGVLDCSVLEGRVALAAGQTGVAEVPAGQRVYFTETKGLRPVEPLPEGEREGLAGSLAFSSPDPLALPFDLSAAVLGLAPRMARLWAAMSPEEQSRVQSLLGEIPELRSLAWEAGIEF